MRFSSKKCIKVLMISLIIFGMIETFTKKSHAQSHRYRYRTHQHGKHYIRKNRRVAKRFRGHRIKRRHHYGIHRHRRIRKVIRKDPEVEYHEPDGTMNDVTQMEYETIKMINIDRAAHNLPALHQTESLRTLARRRAQQLAALDYLTHKDSRGRNYYEVDAKKMKIRLGDYSGENIAGAGLGPILMDSNPHVYHNNSGTDMADMDEDEMLSHDGDSHWGHRYNLLNSHYNRIGIGATRKEGTNNYYLAENFSS